jgi:L-amino acid N-acyltransferase YncA
MTSEPHIRPAVLSDLPRIVSIYNGSIPGRLATADTTPITVEARRGWFDAHTGTSPLWVLETAAGVGAWLSLSAFYGRPAYEATKEVSVYVDPAAQRRGLASLLLEHALREAPGLRVRTLLGFIFSHNAPSLGLFRRYGFATWGELPDIAVLDGRERSLTIVGRRLSLASSPADEV